MAGEDVPRPSSGDHRPSSGNSAAAATGGKLVVLKVGTSSLYNQELSCVNINNLSRITEAVKQLHRMGHSVIVVTSGAVGIGCHRMKIGKKPQVLAKKQALAAIGQVHLMRYYEDFFEALDMKCAQVLVTLDNLADRSQYLNVRNTFQELLNYGAVPIVNENDTVAVQELRFGDNDTLSAHVAALVKADWLFLMTDVDALYTANPKSDPNAQPIYEVHDMAKLQADTTTAGTQWGTGGMATKLTAGRIAIAAGTTMVICNAAHPENIPKILAGAEKLGTKFYPIKNVAQGRKRWILSVPVRGQVWMDVGAVKAVKDRRKSLFCPGITKVVGSFHLSDGVALCDATGAEFARGLSNFASDELSRIVKGRVWEKSRSGRTVDSVALGYNAVEEVVHRDNITLLASREEGHSDDDDEAHAAMAKLVISGRGAAEAEAAAAAAPAAAR
ncbi:hypothetical protein FOA52_007841 [Chlamydomonas sp. UWO 241]|nr:hypothetical protein FOA52_007841 [Chlamydomonas sp. UWO 241]